jgi:hypothetical protein
MAMEASVRNQEASKAMRAGLLGEVGWLRPVWTSEDLRPAWSLVRNRQGYSRPPSALKVTPHEHENLELSANPAKVGKPPGTVMSRSGGGVLVVVGARESRAHGEGGQ